MQISGIIQFILGIGLLIAFFSVPANQLEDQTNIYIPLEKATLVEGVFLDSQLLKKDPPIVALSGIVYDPLTDEDIFINDIHTPRPIASLSKIMTAYVALKHARATDTIVISAEAIRTEGATGDLRVGEKFKLSDLIHLMMIESSNDAATAIAEHVGARVAGTQLFHNAITQFVFLMNEEAVAMGMNETLFRNPTGLDVSENIPSNISTAHDVALLASYTFNFPIIWYASTYNDLVITSLDGINHEAHNTHKISGETPNIIGGKTGFTDLAGGTLISVVEIPVGSPKIIVLLGSLYEERFSDMKSLIAWLY
jgi:serine-type D-Ala-D-Ala carboxypeptidase (penicillin-binding protein 5/6)